MFQEVKRVDYKDFRINVRVNISERQLLIVSGRVLKQCYLHNNMDADCKCIYYSTELVPLCTLDIGL